MNGIMFAAHALVWGFGRISFRNSTKAMRGSFAYGDSRSRAHVREPRWSYHEYHQSKSVSWTWSPRAAASPTNSLSRARVEGRYVRKAEGVRLHDRAHGVRVHRDGVVEVGRYARRVPVGPHLRPARVGRVVADDAQVARCRQAAELRPAGGPGKEDEQSRSERGDDRGAHRQVVPRSGRSVIPSPDIAGCPGGRDSARR